jgi:hypothetical protein
MSEADAMWISQLSDLGAAHGNPDPTHEVIMGKRQEVVFAGSRAACWAFKRANGGFVREYRGDDDE